MNVDFRRFHTLRDVFLKGSEKVRKIVGRGRQRRPLIDGEPKLELSEDEREFYEKKAAVLSETLGELAKAANKAGCLGLEGAAFAADISLLTAGEPEEEARAVWKVITSNIPNLLGLALESGSQEVIDIAVRLALEAGVSAGTTPAILMLENNPSREAIAALAKALSHEDELVSEEATSILTHYSTANWAGDELRKLAFEALTKTPATYKD